MFHGQYQDKTTNIFLTCFHEIFRYNYRILKIKRKLDGWNWPHNIIYNGIYPIIADLADFTWNKIKYIVLLAQNMKWEILGE